MIFTSRPPRELSTSNMVPRVLRDCVRHRSSTRIQVYEPLIELKNMIAIVFFDDVGDFLLAIFNRDLIIDLLKNEN